MHPIDVSHLSWIISSEGFKKQIEETVKEVYPEICHKGIDEVKENVSKAMEQEIDSLIKLVNEKTSITDILNAEKISNKSHTLYYWYEKIIA